MDRSALASMALRLLTGRFLRQKQSHKLSFSNAMLQRRQKAIAKRCRNRRVLRRTMRIGGGIFAIATISFSFLLIKSYRSYARLVDERLTHGYLTSRAGIYAAPRTLRPGQKMRSEEHTSELQSHA